MDTRCRRRRARLDGAGQTASSPELPSGRGRSPPPATRGSSRNGSAALPLESAAVIFEGLKKPGDMSASASRDLTPGFERDIITRRPTFWTSESCLRRDGKLFPIAKPHDSQLTLHRELFLLRLRSDWTVTGGKSFSAGSLIVAGLESFLKGDRTFDVLFEPTERKSLAAVTPTRNHILVTELDNVRSPRPRSDSQGWSLWTASRLPGLPEFTHATVRAVDAEDSDDYFLETTDFLTPTTLLIGTAGAGPAQSLKQLPVFFNATDLAVTQHEAASERRNSHPLLPDRSQKTWCSTEITRPCSMAAADSRFR